MKEYSQMSVESEVRKLAQEQKAPNILICGQTGAGKSSAVNYLFNETVAAVGENGEPCSEGITLFKNDTMNIYDSEGYEIGSERQQHYEKLIFDFLGSRKGCDADAAHLVWYAVSGAGKRSTDLDVTLVKRIKAEGFPVCVLLTKIDELDEDQLNEMMRTLVCDLPGIDVFRLSVNAKFDKGVAPFCDWDKIITWSYNHLSGVFKDRFVAALRESLELKHKQAGITIAVAATAAGAVGASPIPFSDAALLVPVQTGLILKILSLYGIKLKDGAITSIASGALMTNLGKAAAGSLIKLLPGLGSIVGAFVNAGVGSSLTTALGITLSEVCYKYCKDILDGKPVTFDLEAILSSGGFMSQVTTMFKELKK